MSKVDQNYLLEKLRELLSKNIDLTGRRVVNAGKSQEIHDYVRRDELDTEISKVTKIFSSGPYKVLIQSKPSIGPIRKVTTDTNMTLDDEMILCDVDVTPATIIVTMPLIANVPLGQFFSIKRLTVNSLSLHVHIASDTTIDGVASP